MVVIRTDALRLIGQSNTSRRVVSEVIDLMGAPCMVDIPAY